jgi:hypothetical protein
MGCRGVHFALEQKEVEKLLSASSSGDVVDYLEEEIEEAWDEEWLVETDKAWDAIHRCLTDGSLKCRGRSILEKCILGGVQLHRGDDYIISFLKPEEVQQVAAAVSQIRKEWFEAKYWGLRKRFLWFELTRYEGPICAEDLEYSWSYFQELKQFFQKAAAAQRAVVFSVDQ